jgi:acetate---CoA ligase (ADP-forming)
VAHRLDPLLRPRSVAVVGASARPDSLGEWSLQNLLRGGYRGAIYPVNPRYEELQGLRCYARLDALPATPDLVIFGVGDERIEAALDEAIAENVPAAVIMSTLVLDDDAAPPLRERVQAKIRAAGMLVCGANGMGFYNVRDHVWACGFDSSEHEAPGNVALISHSGSGMSGLIDSEERLRINFAVSTGNEIGVTMDAYLDFVLDLPETNAVGLFVETARNPQGFRAALDKAVQRRIPVVALKVGRTAEAARLTVSHSGAMAGDDAAYDALFERYGVQRVRDMDELATALILFAELPPPGEGGLVSLHDSGGERQLMIDLADEAGVPLTVLANDTVRELEGILDPGLPAVNPLDAWSRGGTDAREQMTRSLSALLRDPGAALGAVVHDRAPFGKVYSSYLGYMQRAHAESGKPVALVAARQGTGHDDAVVTSTRAGFPVLDGLPAFLAGVRAMFAYRDFLVEERGELQAVAPGIAERWRKRLGRGEALGEYESLQLLAESGISTARAIAAYSRDAVLAAAAEIGYPLALKTASPGLLHKSEQGGVLLNIETEAQLVDAYAGLSERLGGAAIVAEMARDGVEMLLGAKRDPQFGPVVLLGFGGVYAETLHDVAVALPPFSDLQARRMLDRLRLRSLLDGVRGKPALDVDAFCVAAARFSSLVDALSDAIEEADVNPVIVHGTGCTAVDALVVGRMDPASVQRQAPPP